MLQTTRVESLQTFVWAFFQKNKNLLYKNGFVPFLRVFYFGSSVHVFVCCEMLCFDTTVQRMSCVGYGKCTNCFHRRLLLLLLLLSLLVLYDQRINVAAHYVRLFINGKVCREILSACNAIVHFEIFHLTVRCTARATLLILYENWFRFDFSANWKFSNEFSISRKKIIPSN